MTVNVDTYRYVLTMPDALHRLGIDVGRNGFISCPNHNESEASCKVYEDHVHCFGCGFHADTIGIVRHVLGLDFWDCLEWIAREAGLPPPKTDPETQKIYEARQSISEILEQIFADARKDPQPGVDYLTARGISEDVSRDVVGYLSKDYKPPDIDAAERAGLYSSKGNFLFRDRLIIPVRHNGMIVNLYGRALSPDHKPPHIYGATTTLRMPSTLWGLDTRRNGSHCYLTEGIIDALTLESHGFHALAVFGTQGLTDERVELLKRWKVEKVTLVFDTEANESGHKGALKAGEKLFRAGLDVRIVEIPLPDEAIKVDVNSYFQDHTAEDFGKLEATEYFQYLLDSIPTGGSLRETYTEIRAVLKIIAHQPELLWKGLVDQVGKRFPDFPRQKLLKEIGELKAADTEKAEKSTRFRPLEYVERIVAETPVICFDGRFFRYEDGCYRLEYPEEIDQRTIALIGPDTQSQHLEAVRKFLNSTQFVRPDGVNPRQWLNLRNKLLDLESGSVIDHTPDVLSTVQSQTEFNPEAECPLWTQTVEEILPDPESRKLLAQIFGYSLTADNSYQKGFVFYGEGANGKSVVTAILLALVGKDNCSALHLADFKDKFRLAELQNRLVNLSAEVDAKGLINDARIKAIITGDPMTAERKNQQPFVFTPFCKLIISCNHLPQTTDRSHGYFRRWIILPFPVTFPPEKWDRQRAHKIIQTELSGVLNWSIAGLKLLKDKGHFIEPQATIEALQEYRRQTDPTIEFIEERLRVVDQDDHGSTLQEVYKAYQSWTGETGTQPLGRNNFYKALSRNLKREQVKDREVGRFIPGVFLL
ncbi:MAG: phage/plasmid primase, P4 family [Pseudomonadota bacterium]